jgi:hypothetical protein
MVQNTNIKVKKQIKSSSLRLFNLKNKVVFQNEGNDASCQNKTKASGGGVSKKHGSYARYLAAKVQNSIKNC